MATLQLQSQLYRAQHRAHHRAKISWCGLALMVLCLTGCQAHSSNTYSARPWSAVNDLPSLATSNRSGISSAAAPAPVRHKSGSSRAPAELQLSIRQALAEMVPASYFVDVDEEINLDTPIRIPTTQHWLEALGQGVAEADIELITNLNKKSLFLRLKKRTLAEVIDRLLPADFTVFTAADVNLQTLIHFDTRENWVQAFNHATRGTGIDFSVDFSGKLISLTSLPQRAGNQ